MALTCLGTVARKAAPANPAESLNPRPPAGSSFRAGLPPTGRAFSGPAGLYCRRPLLHGPEPPGWIKACRVLVVDDEMAIRDVIADALQLEGYPVATASNGIEALNVVERERPSVVLLDMRMPLLDGWGFARELQSRGIQVPIICLTAAQNARRWADEIGAATYLAKPFDLNDLLDVVEGFCRGAGW
jgi:CheY-like chemotaxis protein